MKAAIALSCCAGLLLVAVPAFAQQNLNEQDKSFIKATLDANLAQQKLGDLAQHQAQSPTVKAFGQWISADDQFANKRLEKLAGEIGDHQQPELTVKSQAAEKDLQNVKGSQFDQKYMKAEKQAIEKSVALFTSEEKSLQNDKLKDFAQGITPILEAHLNLAKALSANAPMASAEQAKPLTAASSAPSPQQQAANNKGGAPSFEKPSAAHATK
jgi:putative membrane protein